MNYAHEEIYSGLTIRIAYDEDAPNPRTDYDNFGKMACWHRRYNLGDAPYNKGEPSELLASLPKGSVILPLYLYDNSGLTISTGSFSCPWDSGQVGYVYATPEMIRKEYSVKRITKKTRETVEALLKAEVNTYDDYLRGNVYGYIVENETGEQLNSCWGFLGDMDYCLTEARSIADYHAKTIADIVIGDSEDIDICLANAHLIAAAPKLLENLANNTAVMAQALEIVDAYRRVSGGDGDIAAMNIRVLLRNNESAIAAAKGKL